MGFGVDWQKGLENEFDLIDFGFNNATTEVLKEMQQALSTWDPKDPDRQELTKIQRRMILKDLYELSDRGDAPKGLSKLRMKFQDKAGFDKFVDNKLVKVQQDWYGRTGQTQWISDARVLGSEVEAIMVKAKLTVCNHLLSPVVGRKTTKTGSLSGRAPAAPSPRISGESTTGPPWPFRELWRGAGFPTTTERGVVAWGFCSWPASGIRASSSSRCSPRRYDRRTAAPQILC